MQTHPKTYGCNINAYTYNDDSTTSIRLYYDVFVADFQISHETFEMFTRSLSRLIMCFVDVSSYFSLDILSKIISIYVITRPYMSQHPSTLNEEEKNSFPAFSHVTLFLSRSRSLPFYLMCSSRRRLPCVAKIEVNDFAFY